MVTVDIYSVLRSSRRMHSSNVSDVSEVHASSESERAGFISVSKQEVEMSLLVDFWATMSTAFSL
jgi:hypothetical protein